MATHAETMLAAYKTAMVRLVTETGVRTPDGTGVTKEESAKIRAGYEYWSRKVKRERGELPLLSTPNIGAAF